MGDASKTIQDVAVLLFISGLFISGLLCISSDTTHAPRLTALLLAKAYISDLGYIYCTLFEMFNHIQSLLPAARGRMLGFGC